MLNNFLKNFEFTSVQECESTQDLALQLAFKSEQPQLVLTEFQNRGRGRQGSSWLSEGKQSFTCSLALQINQNSTPSSYAIVPHIAGFALWKAISDLDPLFERLCFKWPNDLGIFVGHEFKKTAGILVEIKKNILVVGWGLNVFSPSPLSSALALDQLKNNLKFNKEDFACRLATHFLSLKKEHQIHKEAFEDQFLEFLFAKLMRPLWGCPLKSKLGEGRAIGLGKEGSLIIQSIKKEIVEIKSGEIILK